MLLGVNIRTADREVHFHGVSQLRLGRLVMDEDDVRGDDVGGEILEMQNFLRGVLMNGSGETDVSGAEVDLHDLR